MGTLTYDGDLRVDFDDRLLLHLQLVISAKLRRGESFLFTWSRPDSDGGGRTALWLDRTIPLMFEYVANETPVISKRWMEVLSQTTFQMTGLQIVPDPGGIGSESTPVTV